MTTANVAARTSIALTVIGLLAVGALAIVKPSNGNIAAAGIAVALFTINVLIVSASRHVQGPRMFPRWYGVAVVSAILVVLAAREVINGWSDGFPGASAVALVAVPVALMAAVEVPLLRARQLHGVTGATLLHTGALAPFSTLALDGTDTLVKGKVVSSVDPVDEDHLRNLRWFAGALAHAADTPLAHAVAALSGRGNVTGAVALDDEISGSVDRHPVRLSLTSDAAGALAMSGPWDVVSVEVDGRPLGTLTIADAVRPAAADRIARLSGNGIATVLVAAPEDTRAGAIASQVGCLIVNAPPPGSAVVTSADESALSIAPPQALRLGPQSEQLRLAEASIDGAADAVFLCTAVVAATRRGTTLALGITTVGALLASVGILAPWAAGTVALASVAAVSATAWFGVSPASE